MKKGLVCVCEKCGFTTNEYNKSCPMCGMQTMKVPGDEVNINPTLPDILDNNDKRDVKLSYYCYKHRKEMKTKVCIDCNNVGSLMIDYNGKQAIIKRISHLKDIYTDEEIEIILDQLSVQEKHYIYHNYESAYRFFYKKDKPKAIVCFIFSVFLYLVCLDIFFSMNEKEYNFIGFIFNSIGNWLFVVLNVLGLWYLFDATNVEFKKIPIKVGLIVGIPNVIQAVYVLANNSSAKTTMISGLIAIGRSIIVYVISFLVEKKYEK